MQESRSGNGFYLCVERVFDSNSKVIITGDVNENLLN